MQPYFCTRERGRCSPGCASSLLLLTSGEEILRESSSPWPCAWVLFFWQQPCCVPTAVTLCSWRTGLELLPASTGSGTQAWHILFYYSLRVSIAKVKLEPCALAMCPTVLHRYSLRVTILNKFLVLLSYPKSSFSLTWVPVVKCAQKWCGTDGKKILNNKCE